MTVLDRWIKKRPFLQEASHIPLFGNTPSFDWEQFSALLAEKLELPQLKIEISKEGWKETEEIQKGLGLDPWIAGLHFASLDENAYIAFSRSDQQRLLSWVNAESKNFSTESLKEGLTSFLLLQVIDIATTFPPLDTLNISWEKEEELPSTSFFCFDLQVIFETSRVLIRLILPTAFREKWAQHFLNQPLNLQTSIAKTLSLMTGVEIGKISYSSSKWERVQVGDLLFLDSGTYNPDIDEGLGLLKVEGLNLFQVQILKNRLILQPIHEEIMDEEIDEPKEEKVIEEAELISEDEHPPEHVEVKSEEEEEPQTLKEIPLTISVELTRFQISLERLLQLQPGNTLEIPLDPSQLVSLTLRGKLVAKGELIQLGEKLGIQITSIG